ncbi:hypothetical protein C1646_673694 [Rhizophagus diaphanus]|nr:hypothetical protein C1646_673694 [Rhizophagus diaphanus] [Rhizophagus sp. MUCL 43196]
MTGYVCGRTCRWPEGCFEHWKAKPCIPCKSLDKEAVLFCLEIWSERYSIHIRPFALKGWLMFLLYRSSRRMRIHRCRPKGLCLLILILLYRMRIHRRSAPPHACSLLLPMRCKFLLCQNYNQKGVQKQENKLVILLRKRGLEYIICQLSFLKFSGENNLVCTYFLLGVIFYYIKIIIRKVRKDKKTN